MLAAGASLQAVLQQPLHPCPAAALFWAPYSAPLASLLRASHLAGLQEALLDFLIASVAQRYASLQPAQLQAEIALPCLPWGQRVED